MTLPLAKIRVETVSGELCLTRAGGGARISPDALAQLCRLANVPIGYAKRIPATLLVGNLNHGLAYRPTAHKEAATLTIREGKLESIQIR